MWCALIIVCFAVFGPLAEANCGQRPAGARVINGEEAPRNSWPWQLSLRSSGRHICGASLVKPQWVVTAAHCVQGGDSNPGRFTIVAGAHERQSGGQVLRIHSIKIHERYNRKTIENDVAVIKLASPVQLTDKVNVICLPKQGDKVPTGPNKFCYMTGWGRINPDNNMLAPKLKQTHVALPNDNTCLQKNGRFYKPRSMVCAGGKGSSVCNGDSGGPLSCLEGRNWVLRGAASWVTSRRCSVNTYSVYARISEFVNWINGVMNGNGGGGGGGSVCRDNDQRCRHWLRYCSYNPYVIKNCKKTCRKC